MVAFDFIGPDFALVLLMSSPAIGPDEAVVLRFLSEVYLPNRCSLVLKRKQLGGSQRGISALLA